MTAAMVRIELRRSVAIVSGVLFAMATIGITYMLSGPWQKGDAAWDEQWQGLAQWNRYLLSFTWPMVFAIAVWQGTRERRSRVAELLSSTPRPAWQPAAILLGVLAMALSAGSLAVFLVGSVQVVAAGGTFHVGWVPTFGVGVLALVAAGVLGVGVGRLAPHVMTPPVAGVLALALIAYLQIVPIDSGPDGRTAQHGVPLWVKLLSPAFEGARDPSQTVSWAVDTGQGAFFSGLVMSGFLLCSMRGLKWRLVAVVPTLVGTGLAFLLLPSSAAEIYVLVGM